MLSLFAYVLTAFIVHPHWRSVLHDAVIPSAFHGRATLDPRGGDPGHNHQPLFVFLAEFAGGVEETKARSRRMALHRTGPSKNQLLNRKIDVALGAFLLECGDVFHHSHLRRDASPGGARRTISHHAGGGGGAPALGRATRPLCSFTRSVWSAWDFSPIPTLTGSAAYALAETFRWPEGLDEKFAGARAFYSVVIVSTLAGVVLDFWGINPVKALLYWSAGGQWQAAFALPHLRHFGGGDRPRRCSMNGRTSSGAEAFALVAIAALAMFGAPAVGMFIV